LLAASVTLLGIVAACSSDSPAPAPGGSGSGSGGSATGGSAGSSTTGGTGGGTSGSGTGGSGGTTTGGASTAGSANGGGGAAAGGSTGGSGGSGGAVGGSGGSGGAPSGTAPTCKKETPSPNGARPIECDYLLQSIDFEDSLSYPSPPASIKITNYGKAIGQTAVNKCSPFCYGKNLTVGIDIVGSQPDTLKGEVIAEFPATGPGLPITAADGSRNTLAWITFDGDAAPTFEITTQLVLQTATGVVASVETKPYFKPGGNQNPFGPFSIQDDYSYKNGAEFKYFAVNGAQGFPAAPQNVTGIGVRITAKATAGQEWHGVAYIDHLQVRAPSPNNPTDAGAYPYGL
jgi:hypothetical protein